MEFEKCKLPCVRKTRRKWLDILTEFSESDDQCWLVSYETREYVNCKSLRNTINQAAKRYGFHNVAAAIRGEKVYMFKKEV